MKNNVLKQYFGYDEFRQGQEPLVDGILSGQDVLGIMPTGAGKSICFQVPALILDGITIVISPLISLMQDQVKSLAQQGVSCAYINSSLSIAQVDKALYNAEMGVYKIIYVAPERLLTERFLQFAQKANISMLTVDEAHCISQWGQDFRPSYAQIPSFINLLAKRPVISAFTATATKHVRDDIIEILQLNNPIVITTGFDRANLYFEVKQTKDKMTDLLEFLKGKQDLSGVVYCATRKAVDEVSEELNIKGFCARGYHAGMAQSDRQQNQNDFIYDNVKIIVATNAFGMGIDKSNVNFVVHYNMPKDMESYYQEAGRAGRDGTAAHCLLLYSPKDVVTNQFLIENNKDKTYENPELEQELKKREYERLKRMTFYATTFSCLRKDILQYFGETSAENCGNCGNCDIEFETQDATVLAQKILSCIIRTGERFGLGMIIDVLRGSKNEKVLSWRFDELTVYGICKERADIIKLVAEHLIREGYLEQANEQMAIVKTTVKARDILKGKTNFILQMPKRALASTAKKHTAGKQIPYGREKLFEDLRTLRMHYAKEQNAPAFTIFTDSTLIDMCAKLPTNKEQFLNVSGVGQSKLDNYGEVFIAMISQFVKSNDIKVETKAQKIKKDRRTSTTNTKLPEPHMIAEIEISENDISVSDVAKNINAMLEYYECQKITAVKIANWLVLLGYLKVVTTENGNSKVPTEKGFELGIYQENRIRDDYNYDINMYTKEVQKFIAENIIEILQN